MVVPILGAVALAGLKTASMWLAKNMGKIAAGKISNKEIRNGIMKDVGGAIGIEIVNNMMIKKDKDRKKICVKISLNRKIYKKCWIKK